MHSGAWGRVGVVRIPCRGADADCTPFVRRASYRVAITSCLRRCSLAHWDLNCANSEQREWTVDEPDWEKCYRRGGRNPKRKRYLIHDRELPQGIAEHRALYIPSGYYVVTDRLTLRPARSSSTPIRRHQLYLGM